MSSQKWRPGAACGKVTTMRRDLFILFLLLLAASVPLSQAIPRYPWHYDEGISLYGAVRILDGQVPNRDFFHITTPGAASLLALAFKVAGTGVIAARLIVALSGLSVMAVLFLLGKRLVGNPFLSTAPPALFFLLDLMPDMEYSTHRLAVLFAILSLAMLIFSWGKRGNFYSGILGGTSFLMNQNIGAFSLAGLGLLSMARPLFHRERQRLRKSALYAIHTALGVCLILVPMAIVLSLKGALGNFLHDTIIWPMEWYRGFNRYPYFSYELSLAGMNLRSLAEGSMSPSHLAEAGLYVFTGFIPFVIYPVGLLYFALTRNWAGFSLSLMGTALFLSSSNHPDYLHVVRSLPCFYPLVVYLLDALWSAGRRGHRPAWVPFLPACLLVLLSFMDGLFFLGSPNASPAFPVKTERGTLYSPTRIESSVMQDVISRVTSATTPQDPVFFYHWSPELYFLCNRDNPTMFDTFKPLYTTPRQLAELKDQLERAKPRIIVKDSYVAGFADPDSRIHATFPFVTYERLIAEDSVDRWILGHYHVKEKINIYTILERKDLP